MFIRQDNTLKWKWIGYGALITFVLVLIGLLGGDKLLYYLIHSENCMFAPSDVFNTGFLCAGAKIIGSIFAAKIWLLFSIIAVLVFFAYKTITNEYDFRYAFVKIKNSYVFYVFLSLVFASGFVKILKVIIGRARPMFADPLLFNMFSDSNAFQSMPSGHVALGFAALVMIGMLFPRIKLATWTLAILIALSRVYVGMHWPTDVILGAFIGMVCADFAKALLKKINSK